MKNTLIDQPTKTKIPSETDPLSLHLNQTTPQTTIGVFRLPDMITTLSGTITRDTNNYITSITKGTTTYTYNRDTNHLITSITDGTNTWTPIRNANNYITGWSVS